MGVPLFGGQETLAVFELLFLTMFKASIKSDIVIVWLTALSWKVSLSSVVVGDVDEGDVIASRIVSKGSSLNDSRNKNYNKDQIYG